MEMLVFGYSGYPVILFPTEKGRYYDTKDFGLIGSTEHLLDSGKIRIYCPDSIDGESWYNYSIGPADRVKTHIAYEQMIIFDVIEFAKFETGVEKVVIGGCSLGGYHALNLAFKHPELVSHLISMGGFFDIKKYIYGFYNDDCYFNNPPDFMSNLTDPLYLDKIKMMGITLGTGEWDVELDENKRMSEILNSKEVNHWLDIRQRTGHDWQWWREMFPQYLSQYFQS